MTSPYEIFGTDTTLENKKGIALDYPGFSLTVLRSGGSNKRFEQILTAKLQPYRHQQQQGTMSEDIAHKILVEAYAETVVIGWDGVKDIEGNEIEFSKEACVKLFMDLPDLFRDVQGQSTKMQNFKAANVKVEEKN